MNGKSPERPIKNLSIRIRRQPARKPGEVWLPRQLVDYSAKGGPVRADPPISVGPSDPLLERLKGGQR